MQRRLALADVTRQPAQGGLQGREDMGSFSKQSKNQGRTNTLGSKDHCQGHLGTVRVS